MSREKNILQLKEIVGRRTRKSGEAYRRALSVFPQGEVSAARGFDPWPFYVHRGEGAYIWDIEGNRYIDCCLCYGVLLLGHRPRPVIEALKAQLDRGTHYGAPHTGEVDFAEKFVQCVPSADTLILCNSGNEAIHKAVTLARAYTGKEKVAKFEGGFHGSNEYSMWSSKRLQPDLVGPSERPNAVPEAAGMTRAHKENIVILPYPEPNAFNIIEENAHELAVVMLEPVMGPGMILVDRSFLRELREVTQRAGVLLLYDEIITGFRLALGGGQEYLGIHPDLATFGKALGGGMPIGAIGCKADMVKKTLALDPPLSVAGTFSGNAMTLAAGNALLDHLMGNTQIYHELEAMGNYLRQSFNEFAHSRGYPATMNGVGSMWKVIMADPPISRPRDVMRQDKQALTEFALRLRLEGIFVPAPLHLAFISPAHSDADVEAILSGLKVALEGTFSS